MNNKLRNKILESINKLPFGDVTNLKGIKNHYRLRIGNDYRVIYEKTKDTIIIKDVLPRENAYKRITKRRMK